MQTTAPSPINFQHKLERLRQNRLFEIIVVSVILFSAMVTGVKTYEIPLQVLRLVDWLDYAITIFFVVEISVRFLAEPNKRDFFKSGWNVFDTIIVAVSLIPVNDSELAYVARLIRIFRVLRMVSVIPELRHLLNSLLKALPQLGYVALMMFIIVYIFAAIGTTLFEGINDFLWGDIAVSMLTLFRVMTFEDWTDVMYETMAVYPLSWIYYLVFIFLNTFAFLNMLIGIVVNVMEQERAEEHEEAHKNDMTIEDLSAQLEELKQLIKNKS
ncbi:MAG: ion transporter [Methylophaga sp.]|jgi:voltage-gated sodium channel|uniref:ion transporter n=1 Tax=unclassified Methylophaga TaxID=2629249 RepID=UPI000C10E27B|nr:MULTISPECIES: ion transporter [unclassified Methylophaga]MBL1459257.1 ion transporter [Methylophaga sp.]|tara:strand:- start:326 stop:1135 length:810 start_codon:yes stop_codon:yes gene_type:complete